LQNSFAHECFLDEVAARLKVDPVAYRLRHLGDARLKEVVSAAAKAAKWDTRPSQKPNVSMEREERSHSGRGWRASCRATTATSQWSPKSRSIGRRAGAAKRFFVAGLRADLESRRDAQPD
jgi:CO/xanthine dehydrogenase Mo-binding subunit